MAQEPILHDGDRFIKSESYQSVLPDTRVAKRKTYGVLSCKLDEMSGIPQVDRPDEAPVAGLARSTRSNRASEELNRKSVIFFAWFVAFLVLIAAYGIDRGGWVDELGFQNPPYMLAHFGKLTFPSYVAGWFFDQPVITHPPIHTFLIGSLWRLGFTIYYAEATPTVLLFLLAIVCIVRSAFPDAVKLGLLFSVGYLMAAANSMPWTELFGTRPEGHVHAAWLCGLVLLESGRLANWNCRSLAAGAFLLTWASGTHYYAAFAFTGVAVYAVWAIRSLGWKQAKPRLVALGLGGCLFGIPYAVLYLLPYRKAIQFALGVTPGEGALGASIRWHAEMYRNWVNLGTHIALAQKAMSWGVPLMVYSTAILGAVRWTRGLALAALPLQLFLYLFAWHKLSQYLVHEVAFFAGAVAIGVLVVLDRLAAKLPAAVQPGVLPVAAALMVIHLVAGSPMLKAATLSVQPRVHEAEVARAATREILGPNARVGGDWGQWYASGATHFYDTQGDIQLGNLGYDPRTYSSNLDALVDCPGSCVGPSRMSVTGWFADGTLQLRGFYLGETNDQLRIVLLSVMPPAQLLGYASRNGQLYRFQQEPGGSYDVISAVCPQSPEVDLNKWGWYRKWPGVFFTVLEVPETSPDAGRVLVTLLTPRAVAEPAGWIGRTCRTLSRVPGTLLFADRKAMVEGLRRTDPPMHFYGDFEKVPGYTGVGLPPSETPPEQASRVDNVIDLSKMEAWNGAQMDSGPERRLTTLPAMGAFCASIPVHRAKSVVGSCWVQLRLRVLYGRVGFQAFNARNGGLAHTLGIGAARDPQTIALRVPDFRSTTSIIITNESSSRAQVEVLDATILVPR